MFGIEQEYTFFRNGAPLGWPEQGYPAPQGPYYCGVGGAKMVGREIIEAHTLACMNAGLSIEGTNAEVMMGQWEFQIGVLPPPLIGDEIWTARWLLYRIAEPYKIDVSLDAKPMPGDWNGAGAHTNFSTAAMRESYDAIVVAAEALGERAIEHIDNYGPGIKERLTGAHETARWDRLHLGRFGSGSVGTHPLGGGKGQERMAGGPATQRQHGPIRGHQAHRGNVLRGTPGHGVTPRMGCAGRGTLVFLTASTRPRPTGGALRLRPTCVSGGSATGARRGAASGRALRVP